jgi:RNA polymerase sigma-70 factor (ECF subfamily)
MSTPARGSTDEELALRAGRGDMPAFDELVRRYGGRLIGFLRKRGAADPDDAAQDVWLKVWRALPRWTAGHFRGWLFTIARRRAADGTSGPKVPTPAGEVIDLYPAPPPPADHADELARLRRCLDRLQEKKPDFHTAVVLQMGGASLQEIAAQDSTTDAATVKTRIFRGKKALRECVGGNET